MSLENHSAPGPAAGYTFQFERALYWLSRSPAGFVIGIETEDDVAIKHKDGMLTLEQNKHSIREKAEPFGDRSKDLWNTLSIWLSAVQNEELEIGKSRFFMVTNKALPDGLARQLSNAKTREEVDECIYALQSAAANPSDTIREFTEKVLATPSNRHLREIILNCELVDEEGGASGKKLRESTIAELPIPADFTKDAESILDELLGWVSRSSLALWQKREPAWISRDSFVNQFYAILDLRKRQKDRERAANLIPVYDEQIGREKGRDFVKQIYLVTDDHGRVDESIREFIQCNMEKTRLSVDGNITDQDWIDFEHSLRLRWVKISGREKRFGESRPEEDVGFKILTETTDEHRERLAGIETEQVYLTSGTYHRMADRLVVGWHPRFEELMKQEEGND
ncbi:ABC-three component system protein [Puniceicoccus vermicola]|uniref:ABC-three component systems C-terminal domain-containing protein n=1 Tax=Puniceicoccus vermicola TaxID=388746 RepID=A0A7X1E549_9BACT|nr:ABC-three component system protein [Puniceicoccus vermicola]MBC2601252.1 hypothetical protein [Puniceicoccus vermicola]